MNIVSVKYNSRFSTPVERCQRFTSVVLRHINTDMPIRVLDIGCGTGEQLFNLARALPEATFTGVDISPVNISIAQQKCRKLSLDKRIEFITEDYIRLKNKPFNIIISYSTLHLIPESSEVLYSKICSDLMPGGILINAMPYECAYNWFLRFFRSLAKTIRSSLTDRLILNFGAMLHGSDMSQEELRERVDYMYILPERYDSKKLHKFLLDNCGLVVIGEQDEVHASMAQMKHRITVYCKLGSLS